jgi:hypothetical protein
VQRGQSRHQKAVERKTAKRKEKKRVLARSESVGQPASPRAVVRAASQWPVLECQITSGWNKSAELPPLAQVVVARRAPSGQVAAGVFLVDLTCLGVKDAFTSAFSSRAEYEQDLLGRIRQNQRLEKIDLDCAAKIIDESIAYARSLGFSPHRDYHQAAPLLAGAEPEACAVKVPVGYEGKPYFVSGPHDNVRKILAQLERKVGPGNFHFIVGGPGGALPLGDDEMFDQSEEEEDDEAADE